MVASVEAEFVSKFHSLGGLTMGERRKNLFLLLNETKQFLDVTTPKIDVSSLAPKTFLEENFKIETLLYFKNIPELLGVLKGGNPIFINKILNAGSWFIEEAFEKISGNGLATELFPYLSYNTKLKLIHKLSMYMKDIKKADEYFEAIQENYGTYLASKLLSVCSDKLILKCIETNRIEITPRQLLIIIKRYPTLTESIFEKLHHYNCKLKVGEKYKYIFTYLARNDIQRFLRLDKKYKPEIKLGTRSTNKMIAKEKQNIIESPKPFYEFLKKKRIGKNLKADFSAVYFKLFPKSLHRLEEHLDCHLDLLQFIRSDPDRLKMLLTTFKAKHGNELWDHKTFITEKLIKMMSPDDREIWMQTHPRPNHIAEEEWISFMKTEKSIPLLKQKISFTSKVKERARLIGILVDTCLINNDPNALLDVCKYMMDKHRNDTAIVQQQFFNSLSAPIRLLELGEEHWKVLNQFVNLWKLKQNYTWVCSEIVLKYIEYCFKNNLPVEELLMEWTKTNSNYNLFTEYPEYEKKCLLLFKDMFPATYKTEDLVSRYGSYLNALRNWNARHPKDKFSIAENSEAIEQLKSHLKTATYAYTEEDILAHCVFTEFEKAKEYNLVEIVFKRDNHYNNPRIINLLLQQKPLFVRDNTELVIEHALELNCISTAFHGYFIRYYDHLGIPQKVTEIALKALESKNSTKMKSAARILSYSMDAKSFLNLPALHPSDLIVDANSEEGQEIYKLQQAIFPYLRNMIPPTLALVTVLKFCKGDYLNLIQRSLYSTALNVSEIELLPAFDVLSKRAVSVRKHAIFLGFKVSNKAKAYKILANFKETERNASIHKSLFKAIFNFFLRNSDDYSWELAQQSVKALNVDDAEAFNILTKCRRVPSPYFVRYVVFVWKVLEEFKKPDEVIEEGKCRILDSITSVNISKLPKEFCEKIIDKYFLKSEDLSSIALKIQSFVCKYIIYYSQGAEQKQSMTLVFATLNNYIKSTWYDLKTYVVGRQTVYNFVKELCHYFIEKECLDKSILNIFMALWNDSLKPYEAFEEYLHFKFTLMYLECIEEKATIAQIGEKMADLCNFLNDQGLLVANILSQTFELFKIKFLSVNEEDDPHENEIIMIEAMVNANKSPCCLIVAVCLLSKKILLSPNIQEKYDGIMELLMKESDSLVQIHLHNCFIDKD